MTCTKISDCSSAVLRYSFPLVLILLTLVFVATEASAETWQGLRVEPENRCTPYNSKEYPYSQSVEPEIIRLIGKVYGPYTGRCFADRYQTDIEHIVAKVEAHDSGLCAASRSVRRQFASDLLNLTLASPEVNRQQKSGYDAGEWLPQLNRCWFAGRIIAVKRKYGLSVDRREAEALQRVLSQCQSTDMVILNCNEAAAAASSHTSSAQPSSKPSPAALAKWDDNGNGRITCKEARRHGIAPVSKDHPAYPYMRDGDGDGVVCE